MRSTAHSRVALAVPLIAATLVLAGCVEGAPMPTPTPSASDTPSPTNTPNPQLRPGDSAAANKQFFDYISLSFYINNGKSDGRSIIDNLVSVGFVKADMEVTYDSTPTGRLADSIVFSVRIEGECLVGQVGPNGYTSEIEPLLGTGLCLVGQTRPIDW